MVKKADLDWAWDQASKIRGKNPNLYRRDELGNEMYKAAYGTAGEKSWEIDRIPAEEVSRLKQIGSWLSSHGESVIGVSVASSDVQFDGPVTTRDRTLYLHLLMQPVISWCSGESRSGGSAR